MPARSARNILIAVVVVLVVLAGGAMTAILTMVDRTHPDEQRQLTAAASTSPPAPPPVRPGPVLAPDTGRQPVPTVAGLAAAMQGALTDTRFGGDLNASVLDARTGAQLLDHDGTTPSTPASTTKILTATALLETVPTDYRFTTRVVQGAAPGEIVVIGGGDPTLTAATGSTPPSYPGAARLADLAAAIKRSGVTSVSRIVIDDSRFSGPQTAPGWDADDVPGGYVAPITPFMVDGGRQRPGYKARSTQPDIAAGQALAAALGRPDASVTTGSAPAGARTLGEVHSAPVTRILAQMMDVSDNLLAEMLGREIARQAGLPASFAGAARAIEQALHALKIDTTGLALSDCSGLSTLNRITPTTLTHTLRVAASGPDQRLRALVPVLPVAGWAGTLAERFQDGASGAALGRVRAKTGTLTGVSSLAGVVQDADGRLLVFAFMADQVAATGTLDAEAGLDDAAAVLARCGCR
jgi:D-alanyl-D-alanine carboxypeptidase/D-alanyl-D-alanine-endopeptidase (penicillin-binding protein 4)